MANYTCQASADMTLASTWTPTGGPPMASDNATIGTTYTPTLATGDSFVCGNLTITGGVGLTGGNMMLGNLALSGTNSYQLTAAAGSTTIRVNGNISGASYGNYFNVNGGSVTLTGNYVFAGGMLLSMSSGAFNYTGNISGSQNSQGQFVFNQSGGNLTVNGQHAVTYNAYGGGILSFSGGNASFNGGASGANSLNLIGGTPSFFYNVSGGNLTFTGAVCQQGPSVWLYQTGGNVTVTSLTILGNSTASLPTILHTGGNLSFSTQTISIPSTSLFQIASQPNMINAGIGGAVNLGGVSFSTAGALTIGNNTLGTGHGNITIGNATVSKSGNGTFSQVGVNVPMTGFSGGGNSSIFQPRIIGRIAT